MGRPDFGGGGGGGVFSVYITDLTTCRSGVDGPYRGDWYFPDGN